MIDRDNFSVAHTYQFLFKLLPVCDDLEPLWTEVGRSHSHRNTAICTPSLM